MSRNGFRVLESDLHVIEPRDLYERYLDPRYKARAPRPLDTRQAYVSNWIVDGYGFPRPIGRGRPDAEVRANAVLKEYAAAGFDSTSQLKDMDDEGLDISVLFLTLHDATLAAQELRRAVRELGFVAAQMMPNPVNGVNLHDPRMDPLWAEAEQLGVPICFHPAPNNYSDTHFVNRFLTRPSATMSGGLNNPLELMAAVASMTAGGVLDRFPGLR